MPGGCGRPLSDITHLFPWLSLCRASFEMQCPQTSRTGGFCSVACCFRIGQANTLWNRNSRSTSTSICGEGEERSGGHAVEPELPVHIHLGLWRGGGEVRRTRCGTGTPGPRPPRSVERGRRGQVDSLWNQNSRSTSTSICGEGEVRSIGEMARQGGEQMGICYVHVVCDRVPVGPSRVHTTADVRIGQG